jgi:hypothetical protein
MGIGYQFSDRRSFDYELWYSNDLRMALRGPQTIFDSAAQFWSFVGAAQTFGRFAEKPFPALLSSSQRKPHLNLGFAGAGPGFFANSLPFIDKINQSEVCFLQVMSGRSISTRFLRAVGFGGVLEFLDGPLKGQRFLAAEAYRKLLENYGEQAVADQIHAAKANWVDAYRALIKTIRVPIVGVWISSRDRNSDPGAKSAREILGDFPHLITPTELRVFEQSGVPVIGEMLTQKSEQLLEDFTTRRPVDIYNVKQFAARPNWSRTFNTYYPTPEMHVAIASDVISYLASCGGKVGGLAAGELPVRGLDSRGSPNGDGARMAGAVGPYRQLVHGCIREMRKRSLSLRRLFSRATK